MNQIPEASALEKALEQAGEAHHRYEQDVLHGQRDEAWAGWYAAYLLGRLGDFAPPGELTRWLEAVPEGEDWNSQAAAWIRTQLRVS